MSDTPKQGSLFERSHPEAQSVTTRPERHVTIRPVARGTDDAPSHDAQTYMVRSGRLGSQLRSTLEAVCGTPGLTAMELMRLMGQDRRKRLSDLLELRFVRKDLVRTCRVTGRTAATWVPTLTGEARSLDPAPIVKMRRAQGGVEP